MKKSNFAVIQSLKVIQRRMERLREGFRLEKEEALRLSGTQPLEELRSRAKSFYRVRLAGLSREVMRLRNSISTELPAREEAEDLADACAKQLLELDAHFVSAPSRLMRARKEGLSGDGD